MGCVVCHCLPGHEPLVAGHAKAETTDRRILRRRILSRTYGRWRRTSFVLFRGGASGSRLGARELRHVRFQPLCCHLCSCLVGTTLGIGTALFGLDVSIPATHLIVPLGEPGARAGSCHNQYVVRDSTNQILPPGKANRAASGEWARAKASRSGITSFWQSCRVRRGPPLKLVPRKANPNSSPEDIVTSA
ncbi:hypothetical protein B0G74_6715 [Paraburkholderia sp. BL9I2N2]|jgi:hypothetical protein|nr:hypothetical protein B0G74_6715 [Paraburkholderia sp. BL9I2N2]